MISRSKQFVLLALMLACATVALILRPTQLLANQREKVSLEALIPTKFGDWSELQQSTGQVVNPQQAEVLKKIYTQTLSRSFINSEGSVVMLSIAYGTNQSDGVALHYPEVCYPAQGFQLISTEAGKLDTGFGSIVVKRLVTRLGRRTEPVTYWTTLGNHIVLGGLNTKIAQLKYGFQGQIPDGMLFRVSTIDAETQRGYKVQSQFVADLLSQVSPAIRERLAPTEVPTTAANP